MKQEKEFYAFISYKREDEKWAKWLQDKLEHYKFPVNLNGRSDLPKYIRPTFRDVTDLTPGLLAEEINYALCNSEWLIVICSPRSAKSPWVCKEAQAFIDIGRADHIIPFVIEGNPFSDDKSTECYPEALLNLTGSKELLAANINEMGRDAAVIKTIARMFNLKFDTLWQRYRREERKKRMIRFLLLAIVAFTSIIFALVLHNKNESISTHLRGMQEMQSRAVTEWTEKEEDPVKQIAMLLKVLPSNYANPDRPYTTEAGTRLLEIFNTTRIEKVFDNDKVAKYAEIDKNGENILAVYKEDSATTVKIWNAHKGQAEQKVFTIPYEDGIANFSPNGEYVMLFPGLSFKNILTPCGKILIHNVKTGKKIFSPQEEFDFASFHPHKELILANTYNRGQVKVFDFKKKKELFCIENDGEVLFTKFSPNGNKFIIIPKEGDVQIRNTVTGTVDCTLKRNGFISFYDCSFSPDGSKLVTASNDSTTRVWNVNTGQQIASCKHKDAILQSKFNSDGTEVLAMSNKHVALWNVQDNSLQTNITCKYGFTSASYSYDCKRILTSEDGGDVKIWDKRNGKELVCFKHRGASWYYGYVSSAQYFNNDKNVLTASSDGSVRIWKTSSPNGIIDLVHNKTVDLASFSPDSKQVITMCMWEDTTRIWETNTGRLLKKYPTTKNKAYPSNYIFRNLSRLNLPTNTPAIPWIWNLLNQETPQANMQCLLEKYNSYCAFNKMLLAVNCDKLSLISPLLQTNIYEYKNGNAGIDFVVFDPQNYNIAVALGDSSSVILNGKLQTIRKFKHKGKLEYCALSPDGKQYSTSSGTDSCTITYNLKTGKERYRVKHSDEVKNIQYSPSGNKIGVILSNTVQLIDSSNGNIIGELTHDERINSLQFCSDGSYIATSSDDNSIKIWDSITCQCVYVITHNQNDANYVSFSPNSKYIVTASYDKTAKLYRFWPVQALIEKCKGIINNYELPDENKHNYYLQ